MKKLVVVFLSLLMVVSLVGCSKTSKEYDNDIDKIITYINEEQLDESRSVGRKDINFEVYDVNYNLDKIKGNHNTYKVTFMKKNKSETWLYIMRDDKVFKFNRADTKFIANMLQTQVYREHNNGDLKKEF